MKLYRGARRGAGAHPVEVYIDGVLVGVLRHVVRHSPDGFGWGYEGSGPADLARSLLIDALGDAAWCPHCCGSGWQVWDAGADSFRPAADDDHNDPTLGRCIDCSGERYGPAVMRYQQFKRAVIARLGDVWELTDLQILDWLLEHQS